MQIGILSDTHDQVARTRAAVAQLVDAGAEALIHCGDITVPEVVSELGSLPSYFVLGNCDFDTEGLRQAIAAMGGTCLGRGGLIELGGRRLAITHGDSDRELRRLEALGPDYLLTGHTHTQADVRRGPIRCINPGALHRADTWSVALLDLAADRLRVLIISNASMRP
jgi:putative phosphoesterase